MGRAKGFDEQAVMTEAMQAFRRHGYAGVSVKDLEQATGLRSGSLYHAYGDKDGIYRAAFDHYNTTVVRCRIDRYLAAKAGLAGIKRFFLSLLTDPGMDGDGCLLTNAAVEFGTGPSPGRAQINEGFALLNRAFTDALAGKTRRTEATVLKLLVLYQGILVLIRSGRDTSGLARLIEAEFAALAA